MSKAPRMSFGMAKNQHMALRQAPLSQNCAHIRRLSRVVRLMLSCAEAVKIQAQELKDIVQQAALVDASRFDNIELIAEAQDWRQKKALEKCRTNCGMGLGKAGKGRGRLWEMREAVCRRQREMGKFRECVAGDLQQATTASDLSVAADARPEINGSSQKGRICRLLDSMILTAIEMEVAANEIVEDRLKDFSKSSDKAEEKDEEDDKEEAEIARDDIHPTHAELAIFKAAK
ncbi:hypothetical protein N0V82_007721 [Gnomoniopsis sp. IMI 355080]|nr:hypothetical protein N0V82_007721 [Gnomoniopsis sp. IMI 355080]